IAFYRICERRTAAPAHREQSAIITLVPLSSSYINQFFPILLLNVTPVDGVLVPVSNRPGGKNRAEHSTAHRQFGPFIYVPCAVPMLRWTALMSLPARSGFIV